MEFTPRLALLALLLLVLPAAVTVLFLARNAHPAVASGDQPGGVIEGRLVSRGAPAPGTALDGVALEIAGVPREGPASILARGTTGAQGRFALAVPPFAGHYEIRVAPGVWQPSTAPVSLLGDAAKGGRTEAVVPVRAAARLELTFVRRSGTAVRGGRWTIAGEASRNWFSAAGSSFESSGSFDGAELTIDGLPPMRARVLVRLDGGDRSELVVDLAVGPNRHTVEL